MAKQFAEQLLSRSWHDVVLLARWPRLWKSFPHAVWTSSYQGMHDNDCGNEPSRSPSLEMKAAADLLRKWAPTVFAKFTPGSAELVEARAEAERSVAWLDRAFAATAQPITDLDTGAVAISSRRRPCAPKDKHGKRVWDTETVLYYFRAALLLRDATMLPMAVRLLSKASFAALASPGTSGGGLLPVSAMPNGKTLMRYSLAVDAAAILMARDDATSIVARYGWADSSPQGGRDWLLSMVSECKHDLAELHSLSSKLIRASAVQADSGDDDSASSDSEIEQADQLAKERMSAYEKLTSGLQLRTLVPAALGLGATSIPHKCSAFLHSMVLECPQDAAQFRQVMGSFVSLTTDMGTEMGIVDFRCRLSELMPPWRWQAFQPLMAEEAAVAATVRVDSGNTHHSHAPLLTADLDALVGSRGASEDMVLDDLQPDGMELLTSDDHCQYGSSMPCTDVEAAGVGAPAAANILPYQEHRGSEDDGYSRFLPFAISVPGALHILSNLQCDTDKQLRDWDIFWPQVHNLAALICTPLRRDRFKATCCGGDVKRELAAFLGQSISAPYDKRWGSVTSFLRLLRPVLPELSVLWNSELYSNSSREEANDDGKTQFNLKMATETLASPFFVGYCDMVLELHEFSFHMTCWMESCPCHQAKGDYSSSRKRQQKDRRHDLGDRPCPLAGCRAPELAAGAAESFLGSLACVSSLTVAAKWRHTVTDQQCTFLLDEFERGRAYAQLVCKVKFQFWQKLPWKLVGISHHDENVARRCCREAFESYHGSVSPELHHPLTRMLLEDIDGGSGQRSWAAELKEFAHGKLPFSGLGLNLRRKIAALAFIPCVERAIEAKHRRVSAHLAKLTRHSASRVSLAIRGPQLWHSLDENLAIHSRFVQLFQVARDPIAVALALGFGSHPDIASLLSQRPRPRRAVIMRATRALVYRCDSASQFQNLTTQGSANEKEHKLEDALHAKNIRVHGKKSCARQPPLLGLIGRSVFDHLRHVVETFEQPVIFSINIDAAPHLQVLSLSEAMTAPHPQNALQDGNNLVAIGSQEAAANDNALSQLIPDSAVASSLFFFSVLPAWNLGRMKTVKAAPPANNSLCDSQLAILPRDIFSLGQREAAGMPACAIVSVDAASTASGISDAGCCGVRLLSGLTEFPWRTSREHLHVWEKDGASSTCYSLPGFAPAATSGFSEAQLHEQLNLQLFSFMTTGNVDEAPGRIASGRSGLGATSALEKEMCAQLAAAGFVRMLHPPDVYVLSTHGLKSARMGIAISNPKPVIQAGAADALLADCTAMEMLLRLCDDGWQWSKLPPIRDRGALTHRQDSPKVFFSSPSSIESDYMRVLLSAASLFNGGSITEIPHYASRETYQLVLQGRQPDIEGDQQAICGAGKRQRVELEPDALAVFVGAAVAAESAPAELEDDIFKELFEHDIIDDSSVAVASKLPDQLCLRDACISAQALGEQPAPDGDDAGQASEEEVTLAEVLRHGANSGAISMQPQHHHSDVDEDDTLLHRLLAGSAEGPFRISVKKPFGKFIYGGFQATCPFHRRNETTGCKKFCRIDDSTLEAKRRAANAALWWCSRALEFEWQWQHLALPIHPEYQHLPPGSASRARPAFEMHAPCNIISDLDAAGGLQQPWRRTMPSTAASTADDPADTEVMESIPSKRKGQQQSQDECAADLEGALIVAPTQAKAKARPATRAKAKENARPKPKAAPKTKVAAKAKPASKPRAASKRRVKPRSEDDASTSGSSFKKSPTTSGAESQTPQGSSSSESSSSSSDSDSD